MLSAAKTLKIPRLTGHAPLTAGRQTKPRRDKPPNRIPAGFSLNPPKLLPPHTYLLSPCFIPLPRLLLR